MAEALKLARREGFYEALREGYRRRRDLLAGGLRAMGLRVYVPEGTYFLMAELPGWDAFRLVEEARVALIPASAFYLEDPPKDLFRFAFCKTEEELHLALERLGRVVNSPVKPKVVRYLDEGEFPLAEEEALRLYRAMRRARFFDEKALTLQRQGRLGVYAPFMGQEAAQVGVALALEERDWVVPSYRESAMLLAKGLPIHTLILYWRAHPAGWRFPEGVRAVNPYIPIATQIPQAVGLALAGRYRGEDWVVATSIGDGGTSEGDFHEGLNFAAVFGAPVVFLVQNNGYAISVPKSRQMKVDYVARRAEGYGMPGVVVDGNDAFAVYLRGQEGGGEGQEGEGPTLLEALTYRLAPHTTSDDPSRYRSKEEEEAWRAKDPILRLRKALEGRGLWGEEAEKALLLELEEEFQRELALADEAPEPRPEEIVEHVYAEMGPDQRRAWEALRRGLHVEEVE